MATQEINIAGAGIFGLSVAWALLRRGVRVRVSDPAPIATRTSGGIVGALSPHVPENWNDKKAFQFQSLVMAHAYWEDVARASDLPTGYARLGRLQPLADDKAVELARGRAVTAQELWRGEAVWQVIAADGTAWEPPSPTGMLVRDTLSAHIHPRLAITALSRAIEAGGGVFGPPVEAPTVWAIGSADPLVTGVKGQAALFEFDARGMPQIFADSVHIIPHLDGTTAVGSTSERVWENDGPDALLDGVIARARAAVPSLETARVIERWAGVRPRAKSRAPMLGPHPDKPGDFIANGGFKIGFGMAPLVGDVMADLIVEGRDVIPEAFRA